jgi:dihydropteroate synthase
MGILNATPDSFSDGGKFIHRGRALERALEMVEEGAGILDIGGESSRPGADPVPLDEELRRTIPLIEQIRKHSDIPISIDTTKAEVAREALRAGADIINDISALSDDPEMAEVAAESRAGLILMHRKGTPKTMQKNPAYRDVVKTVRESLEERILFATRSGIAPEQIVLDPGIGFGKTTNHNLELLRSIREWTAEGRFPLLIGASRKNFIGEICRRPDPQEREAGSLAVAVWSRALGAQILRVHRVIDTCDALAVLDTLTEGKSLCWCS